MPSILDEKSNRLILHLILKLLLYIQIAINTNDLSDARQSILNKFPLIVSSILFIWNTISISQTNSIWSETNIKQIRESIVEFVASLTKSNGISFLRAVARCWGERKQQQKVSTVSRDNIGERQALINILMNINNFTINDMIYNMNEFIRTQSITNHKVNLLRKKLCFLNILYRKNKIMLFGLYNSSSLIWNNQRMFL
jgi:hypothetical protein